MRFSPASRTDHLTNWHVQSTEPAGTEQAIWIDNSTLSAPVMRIYLNGQWRDLAGAASEADVYGPVSQTLPAFTQAATGTVVTPTRGTVTQTLPALTQAATGTVTGPPQQITGTAVQTLPALSQSATGTVGTPTTDPALLTEAGDTLTTEAGDRLLLETV